MSWSTYPTVTSLWQAPNTPLFDHFIAGDDHEDKQPGVDKWESTFAHKTLIERLCVWDKHRNYAVYVWVLLWHEEQFFLTSEVNTSQIWDLIRRMWKLKFILWRKAGFLSLRQTPKTNTQTLPPKAASQRQAPRISLLQQVIIFKCDSRHVHHKLATIRVSVH